MLIYERTTSYRRVVKIFIGNKTVKEIFHLNHNYHEYIFNL